MHFPECTTALSWIILLGKLVKDKTACLKLVLLFGTEFQKLERKQKLKHLIWSISWDFTISMISLIQINEYWWIRLCFGNHKDHLNHKDYLPFHLIFLQFFLASLWLKDHNEYEAIRLFHVMLTIMFSSH